MKATGIVRRVDDPGTDDIGAAAEILFCVVGFGQMKGLETVDNAENGCHISGRKSI